jgi:hypothetical protein
MKDCVGIVGSCPELGDWNKNKAVYLSPDNYPIWNLTLSLQCSKIEYKFIIKKPGDEFVWET